MNRLNRTLQELYQKGYEISNTKQLRGGLNSAVYRAKSKSGVHYALKLYPHPTARDSRNRCLTEERFLSYLHSCKACKIPTLIETNQNSGWALLSWIEGDKITSLQTQHIQEIASFICAINESSTEAKKQQLKPASEACQTLPGFIETISKRIKRFKAILPSSKTTKEAINWMSNNVELQFLSCSEKLLNTRTGCSHWSNLSSQTIASPSDVGIHNTLLTQDGLYFFDFEYAGLDDLSKLAADWIMQPECCLGHMQEEIFINRLRTRMNNKIGDSWLKRLDDIKPLIFLKWCLIMLNKAQVNALTDKQLRKTMTYYEILKEDLLC